MLAREQARRQLQPKPIPAPKSNVIDGVPHRLSWLDRHPSDQYGPLPEQRRMCCSCGWVDPSNRLSDISAINHANAHIDALQRADVLKQQKAVRTAATARAAAQHQANAARRAARSPEQKRKERRQGVVAISIIAAVILAIVVPIALHKPNSYRDGVQWAQEQEQLSGPLGQEFPGCDRSYMVASTTDQVTDFNDPKAYFTGAGEPGDNYPQWRAGCESTDNAGLYYNTLPNNGNNVQHMSTG
jgi:hypothetical protein